MLLRHFNLQHFKKCRKTRLPVLQQRVDKNAIPIQNIPALHGAYSTDKLPNPPVELGITINFRSDK